MTLVSAFVILAGLPGLAPEGPLAELPGKQWERALGADSYEHEYQAMAVVRATGDLVVAVRLRPAHDLDAPWGLSLWTVSPAGEKRGETPIEAPQAGGPSHDPQVRDLVVLAGGETLVAVESQAGQSSLLKVARDGRTTPLRQFGGAAGPVSISRIVPLAQGFLLVGQRAGDAYAAKLDDAGNLLWERSVDRGRVEAFSDALPEGGGALLLGSSWSGDPFVTGPSTLWLVKCDDKGVLRVGSEKAFAGRYAAWARGSDGSLAAVYDTGTAARQDIVVQAFTPDLGESWSARLLSAPQGMARFRIASLRAGGYVVVGSRDFMLQASKLGSEGAVAWTFLDPKRTAPDFDLLASKEEAFFIAYSARSTFMSGGQRRLNTKLGLIKLAPK